MNHEAEIRIREARNIAHLLSDTSLGVSYSGSNAFCPDRVTTESDLDMDVILDDVSKLAEVYRRLHLPLDDKAKTAIKYAEQRAADNFMLKWKKGHFDVTLFAWDRQAFENVMNLRHYIRVFRKSCPQEPMAIETMLNLHGQPVAQNPNHRTQLEDCVILVLHPVYERDNELYMNAHASSFLLTPKPLVEHNNYLSDAFRRFSQNVRERVKKVYGHRKDKSYSLLKTLPQKAIDRMSPELREELEALIRD